MSIGIKKTFNLDMVPGGAPPIIHVSAEDVGRPYRINLLYNGEVYAVQGNSLTIAGTKPDKTVFEYDVDDFEQGESYADFTIKEQMAIVPGTVRCKLREYLNDDQIGSATFILDVDEYVYDPEAASESYIPTYETAIEQAIENVADDITDLATAAAINDVKQYADDAEAWATGSVDGTDVTSTADQYHNNAKYYSEQAGEKATAAAGSAADAANSAAQAMSTTPTGYNALVNDVDALKNNVARNITNISASTLNEFIKTAVIEFKNGGVKSGEFFGGGKVWALHDYYFFIGSRCYSAYVGLVVAGSSVSVAYYYYYDSSSDTLVVKNFSLTNM